MPSATPTLPTETQTQIIQKVSAALAQRQETSNLTIEIATPVWDASYAPYHDPKAKGVLVEFVIDRGTEVARTSRTRLAITASADPKGFFLDAIETCNFLDNNRIHLRKEIFPLGDCVHLNDSRTYRHLGSVAFATPENLHKALAAAHATILQREVTSHQFNPIRLPTDVAQFA